ncbi:MAG TPA: phage tail sheath family protein, partial [Syntrophobacteria bacterium]|nr:phage tail sheath family protein [Syntrophobacteria bacterium]
MPEYLTPGVYVEEIVTYLPIEGVTTSLAAFFGIAGSGSLHTPVSVSSLPEFSHEFGGDSLLAAAVAGFFANGGTRCFV